MSRITDRKQFLKHPEWARGATLSVNGKPVSAIAERGFAMLRRRWDSGDLIALHLPLDNRLETINSTHPHTVALVRGPLVLFPVGDKRPAVTRKQLLAARRVGADAWQVESAQGSIWFVPFTSIGDQRYSTYLTTGA